MTPFHSIKLNGCDFFQTQTTTLYLKATKQGKKVDIYREANMVAMHSLKGDEKFHPIVNGLVNS